MSKEQHIHELIDQYLTGELIGQELDKFKIRLKDDPDFLKQVQIQKALIQAIEASREAELRALLTNTKASKKRAFIIPFKKRTLSIAAAILVFAAVGMLIKTNMPNGFGNLAENKTNNTEENATPEFKPKKDTGLGKTEVPIDSITHDLNDNISQENQPAVEIVQDEDIEEVKPVKTTETTLSNPTVDFSDLKEDEDVINADDADYVPQRDSMIGKKSISLYVFSKNANRNAEKELVEVTKQSTSKKKLFERKKNKEPQVEVDKDEEGDDSSPDVSAGSAGSIKSLTGSIQVEFWVSVVNFKGYKFDGQKLLLFDTKPNTLVTVSKYNNQSYVSKNGVYYTIIPNNNFNQLLRVTDPEIIKVLAGK